MANIPVLQNQRTRQQGGPGPIAPIPWWQYLQQTMPALQNWFSNGAYQGLNNTAQGAYNWLSLTGNALSGRPTTIQANANGNVQGQLGTGGGTARPLIPANGQLNSNLTLAGTSPYPMGEGNNPNEPSGLSPQYGKTWWQSNGGLNATPGQGNPGGTGAQSANGGQMPLRLQVAAKELDPRLGEGWAASFTQKNGRDPIAFYMQSLGLDPNDTQNIARNTDMALEAAYKDATFQKGAIADWQKIHGNAEIPQEQWQKWWYQAQNGGPNWGAGVGINPYGNY